MMAALWNTIIGHNYGCFLGMTKSRAHRTSVADMA